MNVVKTIALEVFGLFVDDGWFAGYILVWLAACAFLVKTAHLNGWTAGVLLLVGLLAILAQSAIARSRKQS